jgi:predicted amidohydrolase YtcJ
MRINIVCLLVLSLLAFSSCKKNPEADVVYMNGVVYTVDDSFSVAEAFAVKDGKILAIGSSAEMKEFSAKEVVDLQGKFVYP